MKLKVYYGPMPNLKASNKDMFSKPNSECVALYQDKMERPVIVSKVNSIYMPYRVSVGTSLVVFPTFKDATDYCSLRFKEVKWPCIYQKYLKST